MKVQLLGAANTVTGSCYIVEANKTRFAIDCGMHQGNTEIEKRNFHSSVYRASALDFILLTHAHIDHSGLLPRMAKEGFSGNVYCTEPTRDLVDLMLLDSAHIQEMETEWANRKSARQGGKPTLPLYTKEDAIKVTGQLRGLSYNTAFEPAPGIRVTYRDAGHILGAAFLELEVQEGSGKVTRLVFSGDIGKEKSLIVENPSQPTLVPDYVFLESTYGDRDHKGEGKSLEELAEAIAYSHQHREKVIIPAFAVERTQEVLYSLFLLNKQGKLPADMPVYVDSPLAIRATEVFRKFPQYFDKKTRELLAVGEDPFSLPNLHFTLEVSQSQALNTSTGPAIVISASGMCNAGRIKHHLRHNLWREGASIVFVGYQGVGTPGRKIVDGAQHITILGEEVQVAAKIFTIGGFSGHAGQAQLLNWVKTMVHPNLHVILVHGEKKSQETLAGILQEQFGLKVTIPGYLEELLLAPGKEPLVQVDSTLLPQKINWGTLLIDTEQKIAQLKSGLARVDSRQWAEQTDLRDQLLDINSRILRLLSRL